MHNAVLEAGKAKIFSNLLTAAWNPTDMNCAALYCAGASPESRSTPVFHSPDGKVHLPFSEGHSDCWWRETSRQRDSNSAVPELLVLRWFWTGKHRRDRDQLGKALR
eukprot:SAG31_NODE_3563_length_4120_cov_7.088286_3_plen_107_part_00